MLFSIVAILGCFDMSAVGFQKLYIFGMDMFNKSLCSFPLLFKGSPYHVTQLRQSQLFLSQKKDLEKVLVNLRNYCLANKQ